MTNRPKSSQKQIEFCNEAIRNDMAKVSALLVGVEEEKAQVYCSNSSYGRRPDFNQYHVWCV